MAKAGVTERVDLGGDALEVLEGLASEETLAAILAGYDLLDCVEITLTGGVQAVKSESFPCARVWLQPDYGSDGSDAWTQICKFGLVGKLYGKLLPAESAGKVVSIRDASNLKVQGEAAKKLTAFIFGAPS